MPPQASLAKINRIQERGLFLLGLLLLAGENSSCCKENNNTCKSENAGSTVARFG